MKGNIAVSVWNGVIDSTCILSRQTDAAEWIHAITMAFNAAFFRCLSSPCLSPLHGFGPVDLRLLPNLTQSPLNIDPSLPAIDQ